LYANVTWPANRHDCVILIDLDKTLGPSWRLHTNVDTKLFREVNINDEVMCVAAD